MKVKPLFASDRLGAFAQNGWLIAGLLGALFYWFTRGY